MELGTPWLLAAGAGWSPGSLTCWQPVMGRERAASPRYCPLAWPRWGFGFPTRPLLIPAWSGGGVLSTCSPDVGSSHVTREQEGKVTSALVSDSTPWGMWRSSLLPQRDEGTPDEYVACTTLRGLALITAEWWRSCLSNSSSDNLSSKERMRFLVTAGYGGNSGLRVKIPASHLVFSDTTLVWAIGDYGLARAEV